MDDISSKNVFPLSRIVLDASAIEDASTTRVRKGKANMKQETIEVIRSILIADGSLAQDKIESVLRNLRQATAPHRHLIGARQAMEILGVSRPTLRAYVKQGFISQIGFSSRKVRFDEDEIRRFASNGAPNLPPHQAILFPEPSQTTNEWTEAPLEF